MSHHVLRPAHTSPEREFSDAAERQRARMRSGAAPRPEPAHRAVTAREHVASPVRTTPVVMPRGRYMRPARARATFKDVSWVG